MKKTIKRNYFKTQVVNNLELEDGRRKTEDSHDRGNLPSSVFGLPSYFNLFCSLILICPFLLGFSQLFSPQESVKGNTDTAKIKPLLDKMIYMEGDTFIIRQTAATGNAGVRMNASDSTLFSPGTPGRAIVDPFYISATEVTNGEWKAFYKDKVIELGKATAKRKFFPDTSQWLTEFPYTYNAPMAEHYYAHPRFNDFPVVGITWDQANAYCKWRSKKLNSLLEKKGIKGSIEFRLPTEAEWEYAAKRKKIKGKNGKEKFANKQFYVWPEEYGACQINGLTNIGQIHDVNNVILKNYADDGSLYPNRVGAYPPNEKGMYDMAGSVSEWTSDPGYVLSFRMRNKKFAKLNSRSEVEAEIEQLQIEIDSVDQDLVYYMPWLEHDRDVFKTNDIKICKGGSWANGLIYTQIGSRQGISKNRASTKIGFRVAMSDVNEEVLKYFPKKKWKPSGKNKK